MQDRTGKIARLNDDLRRYGRGRGGIFVTPGFQALSEDKKREASRKIVNYETEVGFSQEDDPHGEHDFGAVEVFGIKIFWKINYHGRELDTPCEDPADPENTTRVLTVMLAEEY